MRRGERVRCSPDLESLRGNVGWDGWKMGEGGWGRVWGRVEVEVVGVEEQRVLWDKTVVTGLVFVRWVRRVYSE